MAYPSKSCDCLYDKGVALSLAQTDIAYVEPLIYSTRVAPDSTAPDASAPKVVYVLRGMDSKPDAICWIVREPAKEEKTCVSMLSFRASAAYQLDTPSLKDCSLGARTLQKPRICHNTCLIKRRHQKTFGNELKAPAA